jgi:hypothetical protein
MDVVTATMVVAPCRKLPSHDTPQSSAGYPLGNGSSLWQGYARWRVQASSLSVTWNARHLLADDACRIAVAGRTAHPPDGPNYGITELQLR